MSVALVGGPFGFAEVSLTSTPPTIIVGREVYEMITDPETGNGLGAYAWVGPVR